MVGSAERLTPEEEGALRELEGQCRRRRRELALFLSVHVSGYTTIILNAIRTCWPPDGRERRRLAFVGANALVGLALSGWSLRREQATERQWTLQNARWHAESRTWRPQRGREDGS